MVLCIFCCNSPMIWLQLMEILTQMPMDNAPLIFELSLAIGQIIAQLANNPCQTLLNTKEFEHLPTSAKLRLLTILPECSLWLDRAETQSVIAYILQILNSSDSQDM